MLTLKYQDVDEVYHPHAEGFVQEPHCWLERRHGQQIGGSVPRGIVQGAENAGDLWYRYTDDVHI